MSSFRAGAERPKRASLAGLRLRKASGETWLYLPAGDGVPAERVDAFRREMLDGENCDRAFVETPDGWRELT